MKIEIYFDDCWCWRDVNPDYYGDGDVMGCGEYTDEKMKDEDLLELFKKEVECVYATDIIIVR
jgi:hypothetical protein